MADETHNFLSLIKPAFTTHASKCAFRPYRGGTWGSVSFDEHHQHIAFATQHFRALFSEIGVRQGDVVGIWVTGTQYEDMIHIMGLIAAGVVPQLFSALFTPKIILTMVTKSGAKAIVADAQFVADAGPTGLPVFVTLATKDFEAAHGVYLGDLPKVQPRDHAVIVHSSGTTSGMPKLIFQTHAWVRTLIKHKWPAVMGHLGRPSSVVTNTLGSLAHVGSFCLYVGALSSRSCIMQSSSMDFSTDQLMSMIDEYGLNVASTYAPFGAKHVEASKTRPEVLRALQSLRALQHTGVPMEEETLIWGYKHGIPLQGYYGTSETGPLMISRRGSSPQDRLLYKIPELKMQFLRFKSEDDEDDRTTDLIYEIVIPRDALDGPDPSFYSDDDLYHTGDIFEQVAGDGYVYRGRAGDWIKTNAGLIDTKAMEDAVRRMCPDIVHDVVIVGQNRPMPVVLIETHSTASTLDPSAHHAMAAQVAEKMGDYNIDRFSRDRVNDPRRILFVDKGTLPRNKEKGNVRRNATEEKWKGVIDAAFT